MSLYLSASHTLSLSFSLSLSITPTHSFSFLFTKSLFICHTFSPTLIETHTLTHTHIISHWNTLTHTLSLIGTHAPSFISRHTLSYILTNSDTLWLTNSFYHSFLFAQSLFICHTFHPLSYLNTSLSLFFLSLSLFLEITCTLFLSDIHNHTQTINKNMLYICISLPVVIPILPKQSHD